MTINILASESYQHTNPAIYRRWSVQSNKRAKGNVYHINAVKGKS